MIACNTSERDADQRRLLPKLYKLTGKLDRRKLMMFMQQAFTVDNESLICANDCAEKAVFTESPLANVADQDVDVVAGLYLGEEAVEPGQVIGRYLPVLSYQAAGADVDGTTACKTLVPFIIAFAQADSSWVARWHASVPPTWRIGFESMAADAIRSYMVDPDRFEQLEFSDNEFEARFALYAALILRSEYCPDACGEIVMYSHHVWALVPDDVRPNCMYVSVTQMPFSGSAAARDKCFSHMSIRTLISQHRVEPGQFLTVMSRNPFASTGKVHDAHPSRLWPLKTVDGVPFTSHDDVAEFETGPVPDEEKARLEKRLNDAREKDLLPHWKDGDARHSLDYSLAMLDVMRRENNDFDGGPFPHAFWTMVLPRSAVALLYNISELARRTKQSDDARKRIADVFDQIDYARCLASMDWPGMLLDLYLHVQGHDYHNEVKVYGKLQERARELCAERLGCVDALIRRINCALPPAYNIGGARAWSCIEVSGQKLLLSA